MALTASRMLALSTHLPAFDLADGEGHHTRSKDFAGRPLLVVFMCNHCPYVKHVKPELPRLCRALSERGVAMVAISSNDPASYPDDGPAKMAEDAKRQGYPFPYLFDDTQDVAKSFEAACTPDFYLFDAEHRLVYRGQLDDSRPTNGKPLTARDVLNAVDAMLTGKPIAQEQVPSIGCNIKWRAGNEPSWW